MRATVHVRLKKSVLDPQGQAIHHAIRTLGYESIREIRQGKYFEIELEDHISQEQARALLEQLARDVLANPVLEEYWVEIEGGSA
ncbi:MAG: phosphoribosylformylglycinamidine synthase subunit PurS [Blastocatellia bacterium]|nr:phosphoribosylformylglycinamidine synthase subunit PurS [Blastocatellia bacterium]MCS7156845.1 phosphoribosylformylglycinamidine synthase subunit PurS [Blastocatellia bacterium]MCX7752803.1 phosphoribosylformylglycinamidine synthase subunit PurS [Blastocatellia bacterium]MDW8167537.1 phosphoribosylformylglycinamidine synthase subunit PurS [Acidobacteriota bacterium]MDW8256138.1 phosphoribosylformylglycinamidine synthase subunit PurS [Acidobacteriota bacterium]